MDEKFKNERNIILSVKTYLHHWRQLTIVMRKWLCHWMMWRFLPEKGSNMFRHGTYVYDLK